MLKFLVLADLHYKKGMYAADVNGLRSILDRGAAQNVDFVIHLGDLCNDYKGSPELIRAYLENPHNIPAYGIYGNHELESKGNNMEFVTPLLCNREVTFGSDGEGYWYTDIGNYRLIGLDTNYSYNKELNVWEHNREASWGAPQGNVSTHSLSPRQFDWFEKLLADTAASGKKALVFSHASFSPLWTASPDAEAVRNLFSKYKNTVIMSINGHLHTDRFAFVDNVAYFDVNATYNGYWAVRDNYHYDDSHTFSFTDYDSDGKETGTQELPLNSLKQGKNTWFYDSPLSAVVTVSDDGTIKIDGSKAAWSYGIVPENLTNACKPAISDNEVKIL